MLPVIGKRGVRTADGQARVENGVAFGSGVAQGGKGGRLTDRAPV